MNKKICLLFIVIFLLFITTKVQAASNVTYFYGEAIKVKDEEGNIEILSDEMIIDTRTSKISHIILLKNNASYEVETEILIPLEIRELSTKVKNVKILLNDFLLNATNNNGEYSINTRIPAGEGKKLEIYYETENDLKKAKVIKYNLDNLKDKVIGKEKVDIIFDEVEIPLIKGIYPGHYTFDNNTISVEYYDMKINTITKDVIIEKETYDNLSYGRENEFSEEEIRIIENARNWIENGIKIDYSGITTEQGTLEGMNAIEHIIQNDLGIKSSNDFYLKYSENEVIDNIVKYVICKQIIKDNECKLEGVILSSQGGSPSREVKVNSQLIYEILYKNKAVYEISDYGAEKNAYALLGKKVCVEFVETEQDKVLYRVEEDIWGDGNGNYKPDEYFQIKERDVLKASSSWAFSFYGAKVIYVGEGIDGSNLNATEEEKIEYINSIGADLYIRNELYSGNKENDQVGYYNNEDTELAFVFSYAASFTEEEFNNREYTLFGNYNSYGEFKNSYVTKLENDYISKNCEVPTVVLFVAKISRVDGKYTVFSSKDIQTSSGVSGLNRASNVIQTERAKQLINSNKQKNNSIKENVEYKISNVKLLENEQAIQEQLTKNEEPEMITTQNKTIFEIKDIIVLTAIALLICICFSIIIINNKRRR